MASGIDPVTGGKNVLIAEFGRFLQSFGSGVCSLYKTEI
jgi:hypothetical protein